ncbi:hypothetical protein [Streptomyces sp. NPDC017890]|uniref:hypothetical protein n=1 Tax=Streptomyces sp. NPDC017890 TaxID=3365015 RepID=UPI0037AFAFA3
MSVEAKQWKNGQDETNPAGAGFGELALEDLREDHKAHWLSSGYVCTITTECGC